MKHETAEQLRAKKIEQLYKEIAEKQTGLREARFKLVNRELKDTTIKQKLRRNIARLLTIVREKEAEILQNSNQQS